MALRTRIPVVFAMASSLRRCSCSAFHFHRRGWFASPGGEQGRLGYRTLSEALPLVALCNDGFGGELAGLELGPLGLLFRGRLLSTNLGILVAREGSAAFFLLTVGRTDLNQLRPRGNGFGDMRLDLRLVAGRVGTGVLLAEVRK